ncbi:MAG: hypothetical protein LC794_20080 [Acidobacteria bacterium]|nr:hypothetical protein [Acidobacteriota bacterium]
MRRITFALTFLLAAVAIGELVSGRSTEIASQKATHRKNVDQIIAGWKSKPQEVARKMIAKYGAPQEATEQRLVWHNNGPWKFSELVNEEIPHRFPKPHTDMLYQSINYRIPPDKFDELVIYDGSIVGERTKGELAARCDQEEANFLAINLANDVVTGKRSVEEARKFYAEAMREMKHPEYKQGFVFEVARTNQGDPDRELFAGR